MSQQAKILAALFTDLVQNIKGGNTAAYRQFFPQGVTTLTRANKAALNTEAAVFFKTDDDQQVQAGAALGWAVWSAPSGKP